MKFIADLHIHSKYSRATSRDMDIDNLNKWAQIKGIAVLGTGDFTHPLWLRELKSKLEPAETGLFKLKNSQPVFKAKNHDWLPSGSYYKDQAVRFILSSEISCIYSKGNKVRKIHLLVLSPNFQTVDKINIQLGWIGNLKSDGRPILGLDAKELVKIVLNICPDCLIIPAHIWTPWFSLFGSKSGFDSISECFDDYSRYIYAAETGLSSDPAMNWRWSHLDNIALVSNSDAHSPSKIGREANVFNTNLSYNGIADALKSRNVEKFIETIEFFPEEGKYHYDGHRNCQISLTPKESKKHKNICPKCRKPLTIGVLHRVDDLADREENKEAENRIPFRRMIPLEEIIAEAIGIGVASKAVQEDYKNLIKCFGQEFKILLEINRTQIENASKAEIAEAIGRVREGRVLIEPGYDGEFGKIKIFNSQERSSASKQASLF